jgi:hypothetical protein
MAAGLNRKYVITNSGTATSRIDGVSNGGRHHFHSNVLFKLRYAGLRLYSVILGTGFDFWDTLLRMKGPSRLGTGWGSVGPSAGAGRSGPALMTIRVRRKAPHHSDGGHTASSLARTSCRRSQR